MSIQKPFSSESERNRREFLQSAIWAFAALPLAGVAFTACTKSPTSGDAGGVKEADSKLPTGSQPAKEEEPTSAALGYKINAAKVDPEKFPKRKGAEGQKQLCSNCSFYTAKNENWGDCQVIRSGVVSANGWCNSWNAKPGAT